MITRLLAESFEVEENGNVSPTYGGKAIGTFGIGFVILVAVLAIFFPASPHIVFPFSAALSLSGTVWAANYMKKRIRDWQSSPELPHEVIDDFLRWKENDRVRFHTDIKKRYDGGRRLYYYGVTEDHMVVFSLSRIRYSRQPKPKNVIALPANLVQAQMKENLELQERLGKEYGKKLLESTDSSKYGEYMEAMKEELSKLEDESETPNIKL